MGVTAAQVENSYADLADVLCECAPADELAYCEARYDAEIGVVGCEADFLVANGLAQTVDCLIDQLDTGTQCLSAAACDVDAPEMCETASVCAEIPEGIEAMMKAECGYPEFTCDDGETVRSIYICDGEPDCADSSDESICPFLDPAP